MSIQIDFDEFAKGSRRALGAAAADIDERGHTTRGEVGRICGEDYQWARHRLNSMRDAGILSQSATMLDDGSNVEKRYTLEDEYVETAETVREALAITGGDLGEDPGADAFYDVVDEVRRLKDRIDDIEAEGSTGDDDDGERVTAGSVIGPGPGADLEDRVDELDRLLHTLSVSTDRLAAATILLASHNDLEVRDRPQKAFKDARTGIVATGLDVDEDLKDISVAEFSRY